MMLTGWMYTDAKNQVSCPKCGQQATFNCRTPQGRKTNTPHVERVRELNTLPIPKSTWMRGLST
jgi:hypothetical protein